MTRHELQAQALRNATENDSIANYETIYAGFMNKGVPQDAITPRVNVFTFHAWKALGRQVRKGEHGVKVLTYVPMSAKVERDATGKETVKAGYRRPKSTTVFHVSQTEPITGA